MINLPKHIEWKPIIIGTISTIIVSLVLAVAASLFVDLVMFEKHHVPYSFTILSKEGWGFFVFSPDPAFDADNLNRSSWYFYSTWFPIISSILGALSSFLGGYITGKIAKDMVVFCGVITGTIVGILFLSWFTPIIIISAYMGALLARRNKRLDLSK